MILGEAYQIKVNQEININIEGLYFEPEDTPIIIYEGSNLLGYLRLEPINLELLFSDTLLNEIIIIKNSDGLAYIPYWDFNGIVEFNPGQGYQIKMNSTQTFYYLEN